MARPSPKRTGGGHEHRPFRPWCRAAPEPQRVPEYPWLNLACAAVLGLTVVSLLRVALLALDAIAAWVAR